MSIINGEAPRGRDFTEPQKICPGCGSDEITELQHNEREDVSLMGCEDCDRRWTE